MISLGYLPMSIPSVLHAPPKTKVFLLEVNENMTMGIREDATLKMPITTAASRGSKWTPTFPRNGAV